jgi:hypothetical protein
MRKRIWVLLFIPLLAQAAGEAARYSVTAFWLSASWFDQGGKYLILPNGKMYALEPVSRQSPRQITRYQLKTEDRNRIESLFSDGKFFQLPHSISGQVTDGSSQYVLKSRSQDCYEVMLYMSKNEDFSAVYNGLETLLPAHSDAKGEILTKDALLKEIGGFLASKETAPHDKECVKKWLQFVN